MIRLLEALPERNAGRLSKLAKTGNAASYELTPISDTAVASKRCLVVHRQKLQTHARQTVYGSCAIQGYWPSTQPTPARPDQIPNTNYVKVTTPPVPGAITRGVGGWDILCAARGTSKSCTQAHLTRVCSLHALVEWHVHASTPSQTLTHQARRPTFFQWTAHIIHHPKPAAAAADHGGSHTPGVTHTLTRPHGATVGPHRATQYGRAGACQEFGACTVRAGIPDQQIQVCCCLSLSRS